jgi:ribonuclease Z
MSLSTEIIQNIAGFSLAKYSTWFYYKPDNILLDAGEGVSVMMRNLIYGVNSIFISHGHGDHIAGIPGILRSRASSMGDKEKPLTIYYPQGDRSINKLYQYTKEDVGRLPFEVIWQELSAGDIIELSSNRKIEAIEVHHKEATLSLGYRILETRNKLKEEFRSFSKDQLLEQIRQYGRESLNQQYTKTLLCYSGDTMPLSIEIMKDAEVVLHDTTFLNIEDRDDLTHATIDEVFANAVESNISVLGLFHFSTRYKHQEIVAKIQKNIEKYKINFPIYYIFSFANGTNFKKCISK